MKTVRIFLSILAVLTSLSISVASNPFEYKVRPGDDLSGITRQHYGSRAYMGYVAEYNGIEHISLIRAGSILLLPPLPVLIDSLISRSGATNPALSPILRTYKHYHEIDENLWAALRVARKTGRSSHGIMKLSLSSELKDRLELAANMLKSALNELERQSKQTGAHWSLTQVQIRNAISLVEKIKSGACDENGYDIDMVHQRISIIISYLMHD